MEGKFTFVDQRVLGLLGYSPPELLGKPCFEYFHPEDQSHMKESFEQGMITDHNPQNTAF
jgi:aryl hydrocarbon receptor nuclear translocator